MALITPEQHRINERNILTAPSGMFVLVYTDPRDHWSHREGRPVGSVEEAITKKRRLMHDQQLCVTIHNDKGELVNH